MTRTEPRWPRRSDAERQRRRVVETCLARRELLRRPRPVDRGAEADGSSAALGRRLRGALEELGPVFAAFGLSLARRIDLLPAGDLLELATIPDGVPPLPPAELRERLASELGRPPGEVFAELDEEPFDSRLLEQAHRGRLAGGEPVIVRLIRGETGDEELDLGLLSVVAGILAEQGWVPSGVVEAAADFRRDLRQRTDLRAAAQGLELLAADAAEFGRLAAPGVHRELSTSRVLVHADLEGISLGGVLRSGLQPPWSLSGRREDLARRLALVWLRQALLGRQFPVELREEDVRILPTGQIGFQGIALLTAPAAAVQTALRDFLLGVAAREPDAVCAALLRESTREDAAAGADELHLFLRQVVPFRDGAWSPGGESLAEHAFASARTARSHGYRPRQALLAFYRGLFDTAEAACRLAPDRDALREGLQELRLLTGLSQVGEAVRPDQWGRQLDLYATLLTVLPQRMDRMLSMAADDRPSASGLEPEPLRRRADGAHWVSAAWVMVLAACALLLHRFVQSGALAGEGEKVAAALFLVFGVILLWCVARTG